MVTTEIRCKMNKRDYLKKRAVKSNSKSLHRVYKAKRNEVNKNKLDLQNFDIVRIILI
jgi:hypothetical protein